MPAKSRPNRIEYSTFIQGFEAIEAYFSDYAFSPHRHDTYGIGYTTAGIQVFTYRGATRYSCPGEVFVLHPDEEHDGRPGTEEGYGYRILYIAPELICGTSDHAVLPFVTEAVSANPRLKAIIRDVFCACDDLQEDLQRIDLLTELADRLIQASDQTPLALEGVSVKRMRKIWEHLLACAVSGISLSVLEREHGMDRYSISRHFRRLYGVSPYRFITLRRLDLVKKGIRDGMSLAEAALAAGFADQSHMTRHFRKAFGLSPGMWRSLLRVD